MEKTKVAVIFPKYQPDDSSHFPYWYRLFEEAGKKLRLKVFFETGRDPVRIKNSQAYLQKLQIKPLNLGERLIIFLIWRINGFKYFYVHYSLFSFFLAKLITTFFGGKVYLWDCEYYQAKPDNFLLRLALSWCDVLVTGHEKIANQYKKVLNLTHKRINIVPSWVKKIKAKPKQLSKDKLNILFIHHLSLRKGSREMPKIIELVFERRKDVEFTIVGDGPDFDFLKSWAKEKGYEKIIKLTGRLSPDQVREEFVKADFFILPSRSEGFPRVILEAMKYGIPYVATNVGCVSEISPESENNYLVLPGNPCKFADKLLNLLSISSRQYQLMSRQLKEKARDYALKKTVKAFINIFN